MVLFIHPTKKTFFFKFVQTTDNTKKDLGNANDILDLLEDKPSEITQWNYYGYVAVFMANNVGSISPLNGFQRIYCKERLQLEKELEIM